MHLVFHHVAELQEVCYSHCSRLVELLACLAVVEVGGAQVGQAGLVGPLCQVVELGTIEDRGGELDAEALAGSTEDGLENLAEVHTRRHTQRVEHEVDRTAVLKERHVFLANHLRHDALVTVASGQLVAYANLALLGHIDLGHLEYARRQLVANGYGKLLALHLGIEQLVLLHEVDDELAYELVLVLVVGPVAYLDVAVLKVLEVGDCKLAALGNYLGTGVVFDALRCLAFGEGEQLVDENVLQVVDLCLILLVNLCQQNLVLLLGLACLDGTGKEFLVDDDTRERRVGLERRVFHIAGLVAEDGAEQLLLGRRVALALRRNLADEDVARLDTRSDAYDSVVVEVFCGLLADIGDVACEFLDATLRLTDVERILVYVDRGEHVFTHDALVEHDGVLVVVTLPRHVCHKQVAAQCELTVLCGITLGKDVAFLHALALVADRTQVDGHVLVGAAELRYAVFLQCRLEAHKLLVFRTVVEYAYGGGVDILDHAIALGGNHRTGVLAHLLLNAGTHDRGLVVEQGHCLAHHVRTHERTVGVVVLEEGDERCGDRGYLLRRHIHEVYLLGRHYGEVGVLTTLHHVADKRAIIIQRGIALANDVVLFFLGCEINNVFVLEVGHAILYLAVRCLYEAELVDLGVDAK